MYVSLHNLIRIGEIRSVCRLPVNKRKIMDNWVISLIRINCQESGGCYTVSDTKVEDNKRFPKKIILKIIEWMIALTWSCGSIANFWCVLYPSPNWALTPQGPPSNTVKVAINTNRLTREFGSIRKSRNMDSFFLSEMFVLLTLFGEFFTKKFPLRRHGSQTSGEASASVFRSEPDVRSAIFDAIAVTRFWHVSRVSSAVGRSNGSCGHLSRSLQIFNSDSVLDRALFSFNNKRLMRHFTRRSVIVSFCPFSGRISDAWWIWNDWKK